MGIESRYPQSYVEDPVLPALLDLRGEKVGVLWNGKTNGDQLFLEIEKVLRSEFRAGEFVWADKASEAYGAAQPAPSEMLDRFAGSSVVLTGPGDCGSCTSRTVRDAIELRRRGIHAVVVCTTAFRATAQLEIRTLGTPDLPIVAIGHPLLGRTSEQLRQMAEHLLPAFAEVFTIDPAARNRLESMVVQSEVDDGPVDSVAPWLKEWLTLAGPVVLDRLLEHSVSAERVYEILDATGLGDGLPVAPVQPDYVTLFCSGLSASPDDVVADVPPLDGRLTAARLAECAALAGCLPEHAPVLAATVRALSAPELNAFSALTTTGATAFMIIVNGPVSQQLGFTGGANCLGPGNRSNATVGRCLSLLTRIVGGAREGAADGATQGQPGKYTFCFAENEERSPWPPLHVERGLNMDESAVTVACVSGTIEAYQNYSADPNEHIAALAPALTHCHAQIKATGDAARGRGLLGGGQPIVILSPEWAANFADAGWDKLAVKSALWQRAVNPDVPDKHIAREPADIVLVVAGGHGYKQTIAPNWIGGPRAITVAV